MRRAPQRRQANHSPGWRAKANQRLKTPDQVGGNYMKQSGRKGLKGVERQER